MLSVTVNEIIKEPEDHIKKGKIVRSKHSKDKTIILITDVPRGTHFEGVVVSNGQWGIGYYSKTWLKSYFYPYNGTIVFDSNI